MQPMHGYAHPESLVTTEWLDRHLVVPDVMVIDARFSGFEALRAGYEAGHIPGAAFVDYTADLLSESGSGVASPDRGEAVMRRLGVSNSSTVIAYDQSFGAWAAYVWWVLRYLGHNDVRILDGGWDKWVAEGRRAESGIPAIEPGDFTAQPREALRARIDEVRAALHSRDVVIVDALPGKIYRGEAPMFPTHRLGHIPGAKNISAPSNINRTTNVLLPMEQLSQVWDRLELTPRTKVITYCGAGPYGAFDLFALHLLGHENAVLYDGCWLEWGARDDLPIEVGPEGS
jgi:thiosulfate/3-mercaptopyruvate sulfurtransferase